MLILGVGTALIAAGACDQERPLSPLIQASRAGSLEAIKRLLDSGADVNLPGPTGDSWDATPLQHAILARQPDSVRLLLDRGADPNRSAGPGSVTPLLLAAGDTDPTILNLLLAHGADPTVEAENGVTPLSRAVSAGTLNGPDRPMFGGCRVETVRSLLAHHPGLRLKRNLAGHTAISWARVQGCEEVLKLIGEPPTKRGQRIVAGVGLVHDRMRQPRRSAEVAEAGARPPVAPARTPATGAPSAR
jgi:ankyrin repeat protein